MLVCQLPTCDDDRTLSDVADDLHDTHNRLDAWSVKSPPPPPASRIPDGPVTGGGVQWHG